jgi:hypothetical protein
VLSRWLGPGRVFVMPAPLPGLCRRDCMPDASRPRAGDYTPARPHWEEIPVDTQTIPPAPWQRPVWSRAGPPTRQWRAPCGGRNARRSAKGTPHAGRNAPADQPFDDAHDLPAAWPPTLAVLTKRALRCRDGRVCHLAQSKRCYPSVAARAIESLRSRLRRPS